MPDVLTPHAALNAFVLAAVLGIGWSFGCWLFRLGTTSRAKREGHAPNVT